MPKPSNDSAAKSPDGHGKNPTPQQGSNGTDIKDESAEGEHLRTERAQTTNQDGKKNPED